MFRQSPRRNQRNKGFKVKHALQICLLLAVSIWLLYQVQHSRNKKAAIGESTKISKGLQNGSDIIKLGRKDLQPHVEGSTVEDVRQKEDREEESQERVGEEGEHKKDFIDEKRETEAQKEETDERKDTDVKEEERDEDKEEAKDGNKESAKESNDIGKEEVEREEDEREESKEEEEKENGSEGTEEKSSEENLTTENGDSKENGNEETQGKSSEENNSRENGESKENKEEEGKGKEIEDKKLRNEKMIESKATGSEESGETKTDETREEKEGTVEDTDTPENQVPDRNDGEAAREENHEGENNVSSGVDRETQNISETEGGITEKSNAGEQIENTEGHQFEEKETKNTEATSLNQNNAGSNVTENAIMEKNDSAVDSLGNKNGASLLETEDSSNQTTATTETGEQLKVNDNPTYYDGGKPASDPTSDTSQNQNKMVDNIIPFEDSTQTLLKEQTEKPEEMTGGQNSDLNSAPPATTGKKDLVNGDSIVSFDNIETLVLDEQSAKPSTSNKTQNSYENSTWNEDNDTLQSHTNSEIPGTEEHRELSNGNANADSGQTKTGEFSTSSTITEKEASSSPNDNADASKHDEVNSDTSSIPQDEKEARRDPATLPESGTEGNNHEVAAEK